MRKRLLTRGAAILMVAAIVSLAAGPAAAQAQPSSADGSAPHQTPWGDPDLQGVWDRWTFTPLERPEEFAAKDVLTDEEAAEVAQREFQATVTRDREGPAPGDPGGYGEQVWTDRARATALNQSSLIVEPADGRLPALTAAAERRSRAHRAGGGRPVRTRGAGVGTDGPEDRGLSERCIMGVSTGLPLLPSGYNNNIQIFQTPELVALAIEMVHDVRIVPLDGRPHLPSTTRQWMGDARGRWEGDTLVVETTNFTDKIGSFSTSTQAWGTGEYLQLTERFTRVDEDTLLYESTVENPTVFSRPFTISYPMALSPHALYEFACHEGNYGLYNILSGARAEDRALAGSE